jgi:hypothetical protein
VAEWSIAPVLKTGNGKPFVSSNLTASARLGSLQKHTSEGDLQRKDQRLLHLSNRGDQLREMTPG